MINQFSECFIPVIKFMTQYEKQYLIKFSKLNLKIRYRFFHLFLLRNTDKRKRSLTQQIVPVSTFAYNESWTGHIHTVLLVARMPQEAVQCIDTQRGVY